MIRRLHIIVSCTVTYIFNTQLAHIITAFITHHLGILPCIMGRPEWPSLLSRVYTAYPGREGVKGRCTLGGRVSRTAVRFQNNMSFIVHCHSEKSGLKINIFKILIWGHSSVRQRRWGGGVPDFLEKTGTKV